MIVYKKSECKELILLRFPILIDMRVEAIFHGNNRF